MTKICRNSYKGEGNNLNFHDNLTHGLGPHQEKTSFFFNWRWYFKVVAWFFSRSYSVFWLFPLCTRNLHIIKLLFIFISGRIQPRTQKGRGKTIFPPLQRGGNSWLALKILEKQRTESRRDKTVSSIYTDWDGELAGQGTGGESGDRTEGTLT